MDKPEHENTDGSDEHESELDHDERHPFRLRGPTPPEARVIHELIPRGGRGRCSSARSGQWPWSALGAGLSMGFSFFTMAIIRSALPESAPWTKLVAGFGYTIGFIIVILGRQQLFTESTLSSILPLLTRKDMKTLWQVARLWAVVLVFNIIGTFVFAWLVSHSGLFDDEVNKALRTVAEEAIKDSFVPTMVKAILAGWLIALIVWLIPGAGQSRLAADLDHHLRRRGGAFLAHHRGLGGGRLQRLRRPHRLGRILHPLHDPDADRQHDRRRLARRHPQPRPRTRGAAGGASSVP